MDKKTIEILKKHDIHTIGVDVEDVESGEYNTVTARNLTSVLRKGEHFTLRGYDAPDLITGVWGKPLYLVNDRRVRKLTAPAAEIKGIFNDYGRAHLITFISDMYEANENRRLAEQRVREMHEANTKFELSDEIITHEGVKLHRIVATRNFKGVKSGEKGGWVEHEGNLDQNGDCWIFDNAKVYGGSVVTDNAVVSDKAEVFEAAIVDGKSLISGTAEVSGKAVVTDSKVSGSAIISGFKIEVVKSEVSDAAQIADNGKVKNSKIAGQAYIGGNAEVTDSEVYGEAKVGGIAQVTKSKVYGKATVIGKSIVINSKVYDFARFSEASFATVRDSAVYGSAVVVSGEIQASSEIYGSAIVAVHGNGEISGSKIRDKAEVKDQVQLINSTVEGNASVTGNAILTGATVKDKAVVSGNAKVSGTVSGSAIVDGKATVNKGSIVTGVDKVEKGTV